MKEIELKFQVKSLRPIVTSLKKEGCVLSKILDQKDTVFVPDKNNTDSCEGSVWLRVREENKKVELNYKKQGNKKMSSKEIEFKVDSSDKAKEFLDELGFEKWVVVHKKRRTTKYKKYNICLDEVVGLGFFVEIELLVPEDDNNDYEEELHSIAYSLNISRGNRINSHYDTMIKELEDNNKKTDRNN